MTLRGLICSEHGTRDALIVVRDRRRRLGPEKLYGVDGWVPGTWCDYKRIPAGNSNVGLAKAFGLHLKTARQGEPLKIF